MKLHHCSVEAEDAQRVKEKSSLGVDAPANTLDLALLFCPVDGIQDFLFTETGSFANLLGGDPLLAAPDCRHNLFNRSILIGFSL